MALYRDHVLPRLVHLTCAAPAAVPVRQQVCRGLRGSVLEIGFGSGANVPWYPSAVTEVAAVEPADVAWRLAGSHLAASSVPVRRVGRDAQQLDLPSASVDSALSTFTLCTVPDPVAALREVARLLRPGGALHFLEHGLAPDVAVQRWQHRLDPLQHRVAGGCHLDRPMLDLLAAAGLVVVELQRDYLPGSPKVLGALYLGTARVGADRPQARDQPA